MKHFQPVQTSHYRQVLKGTNKNQQVNWQDLCYQLEQQKNFFKEQYQKLYQSYCQKKEKMKEYKQYKPYIKQLEERIRLLERKNQEPKDEPKKSRQRKQSQQNQEQDIYRLKKQNEILTEKLINKNQELEELYMQLQQSISKGGTGGTVGFNIKGVQSQFPLDFIKGRIASAVEKNFEQLKKQASVSVSGLLSQPIQHPPPVHRIISMPPFAQIPVKLQHVNTHSQIPIVQHGQHFEFLPPVQHIQASLPIFSGQIPIVQPLHHQIQNVIRIGEAGRSNIFPESNNPAPSAAVQFCPITPIQP